MPFDAKKAREALQVVSVFKDGPMGQYLAELGLHLKDAMDEIAGNRAVLAKAETDRNKAEEDRDSAINTARRLREGNTGLSDAVDTLKAIAKNPKGAAKLAEKCVAKIEGGAK